MNPITIINYQPKYQVYFEKFNRYWIEKYFKMEELDEFVLTNPDEAILKPGGAILMALYDGTVAGTVALRKVNDTVYEFTKMAVEERFQRKGIAIFTSDLLYSPIPIEVCLHPSFSYKLIAGLRILFEYKITS